MSLLLTKLTPGQTKLTPRQIAEGEALGRTTDHSLKFGNFASIKGENFQAFILSPVHRVAYTTSEEASTHHKDILKDEINLNRMRVSITSFDQHQPRYVVLVSGDSKRSLKPAHLVLEMNQALADAEFEMTEVTKLGAPNGTVLIEVTDEKGTTHHPIPFDLGTMKEGKDQR